MSGRDVKHLDAVRANLPAGAQVTVAWLPNETAEQRVAAAAGLAAHGLVPVPHIAARQLASRDELDALAARFAEAGVRRVFVIGGDVGAPKGPFGEALDVIASGALQRAGLAEAGVAFYPEGHPAIGQAALARAFAAKIVAAADGGLKPFVITQFCFSSAPILAALDALKAAAPQAEVRIGIAGPTNPALLMKYALRCGVASSAKFAASKGSVVSQLLMDSGPEPIICELARDPRLAAGDVGVHFFAFGGLERTTRWMNTIASGGFSLTHNRAGFRVLDEAKKK
jgi:methylenetetrahydrofolate reductase (NADPH)